jgi:hypothetical protein
MFQVHPIGTVRCAVSQMSQGKWATVDSEIQGTRKRGTPVAWEQR